MPVRPWSFRRLGPKTLGSQMIVFTILAILLSNAMVVAWFTLGHQRENDEAGTIRLLDRAAATAILMNKIPQGTRETALRAISNDFWGIFGFRNGPVAPTPMTTAEEAATTRLKNLLPAELSRLPVQVHFKQTLQPPRIAPPGAPPPRFAAPSKMHFMGLGAEDAPLGKHPGFKGEGIDYHPIFSPPVPGTHMEVVIPISDNTQLVALFFRPRGPFWSGQLLLAALITILFSSLAAAFVAQRVSRPLSKLAEAAGQTARGAHPPHVPEEGPTDVRRAAEAFNAMTDQVTRTLNSQRHLLSAVGHDLRTPITAMRINIEFVQDTELADRLAKNLDELQALTEAVLAAARGTSGEDLRNIDLCALVESICADLDDLHVPVTWLGGIAAPFSCRANEMRRAIRNLIENAVAYGKKAEVAVIATEQTWQIQIADEGPGIPIADQARVFEPFVRLESSRNAATGGVGLGLTLAKSIVEGHRGNIEMGPREDKKGFLLRIVLPR